MGIKFCTVCGEVDVSVSDEVELGVGTVRGVGSRVGTKVVSGADVNVCGSVSVGMSIRLVVRLLSRDEVCVSVSAGVSVCDWVWDGEWVCVSVRI